MAAHQTQATNRPPRKPNPKTFSGYFSRFASGASQWVGSSWAFVIAALLVAVWLVTGPLFDYSNSWQLVINTATTIITFIMVFLIQNTQNRDARAIHLKLDEIIRSIHQAHNEMIDIEHLSDDELKEMSKRYERFRQEWEQRKANKKISA